MKANLSQYRFALASMLIEHEPGGPEPGQEKNGDVAGDVQGDVQGGRNKKLGEEGDSSHQTLQEFLLHKPHTWPAFVSFGWFLLLKPGAHGSGAM